GGLTRERGTRLLPKPKAPKPLIQLLLTQAQANLSGTDVRRLSQNLRDWEPPCRVRVTNGDVVDLHGALLTKELLRRLQCFCFKTGLDREDLHGRARPEGIVHRSIATIVGAARGVIIGFETRVTRHCEDFAGFRVDHDDRTPCGFERAHRSCKVTLGCELETLV